MLDKAGLHHGIGDQNFQAAIHYLLRLLPVTANHQVMC